MLQTVASLSRFIPFKKNRLRQFTSASSPLTDASVLLNIRRVPLEGDRLQIHSSKEGFFLTLLSKIRVYLTM